MGQSLFNKKTCLYFLDEMSLAAARQVNLSRLKIKTRLFVDQGLSQCIAQQVPIAKEGRASSSACAVDLYPKCYISAAHTHTQAPFVNFRHSSLIPTSK